MGSEILKSNDAFGRMDAMYRHQRHFYDATRKFYLLGRDRMLNKIELGDCDQVAEIGCGTGRNLKVLAERFPTSTFYGIDASFQMLEKAKAKFEASRIRNVQLACVLAENFSPQSSFGVDLQFDSIIFSYSISMIPSWKQAIRAALSSVRPGGTILIVDFFDQAELPGAFRGLLSAWLRQFGVKYFRELMPFLEHLEANGEILLKVESVARRYAFIATITKV